MGAASDSAATAQARVDAAVIMLETLRPESVGLYCVPRLRQQAIGVRLRQMFDEVVNEDVPDEFLEILRRADERGSEKA